MLPTKCCGVVSMMTATVTLDSNQPDCGLQLTKTNLSPKPAASWFNSLCREEAEPGFPNKTNKPFYS